MDALAERVDVPTFGILNPHHQDFLPQLSVESGMISNILLMTYFPMARGGEYRFYGLVLLVRVRGYPRLPSLGEHHE